MTPSFRPWWTALVSSLGIFAALAVIALSGAHGIQQLVMLGSFGSSAVVVFYYPHLPIAQPRSLVGGHLICSAVGVAFWQAFGPGPWSLAASVAVAAALMQWTGTLHPPAGGNPILAFQGQVGAAFVLVPTLLGVTLLLLCAWGYHRLCRTRYPTQWW